MLVLNSSGTYDTKDYSFCFVLNRIIKFCKCEEITSVKLYDKDSILNDYLKDMKARDIVKAMSVTITEPECISLNKMNRV
jgi:hypothetical protein